MSIAANTYRKIEGLPAGQVFTYKDVLVDANKTEAVIKALNRMAQSGTIGKLAKGKYYRPEVSRFGLLEPGMDEVLKDLLFKDGKRIGYYTGLSVYNRLGLTTQVSFTVQIGRNDFRPAMERGYYRIKFLNQKNEITKESVPALQLLDAIRTINQIPDAHPKFVIKRISSIVKGLSKKEKELLVELALKYPPRTRAILGAILDDIKILKLAETLLESLNPVTTYSIPGAAEALTNGKKWNIL